MSIHYGVGVSFEAKSTYGHFLHPVCSVPSSASKRLHDLIRQPYDMFRPGVMDEYIMGMANQPCQTMDDGITQEVSACTIPLSTHN